MEPETPPAKPDAPEAPAEAPPEPEAAPAPAPAPPAGALDLSRSMLAQQAGVEPVAPAENAAAPAPEEEPAAPVDLEALARTVEALLFASDAPLAPRELARAASARTADVRKALGLLQDAYAGQRRAWELAEVAGGYRLVTRPEFFPAIQKLKTQRTQRKLTPAALETLALVAYSKEPIGRAEVESVRGVDSGPVLRLLLERKLIRIAGRGQGLGQPLLYAVSSEFLEHFGLKSAQDLPQPGEMKVTAQ